MNKEEIPKKQKEKKNLKQTIRSLSLNRIRNEHVRVFVKGLLVIGSLILFGFLWTFPVTKAVILVMMVVGIIYVVGKFAEVMR